MMVLLPSTFLLFGSSRSMMQLCEESGNFFFINDKVSKMESRKLILILE